MANLLHLTPLDPRYPTRLRGVPFAPASLAVQGGSTEAACVVAIVGSRAASANAARFANKLAQRLVRAGAVVCSGGALGIDGEAHRGAMAAGGRTWVVSPTGPAGCFPPEHVDLFAQVAKGPSAMLWPRPSPIATRPGFHTRNNVLVALSDAVVVVQAGKHSGALHAASCAKKQGKPLWVAQPAVWSKGFSGSRQLLESKTSGARALTSSHLFLRSLGLSAHPAGGSPADPDALPRGAFVAGLSPEELRVLKATTRVPQHLDAVAAHAGSSPQATTAALLTLALENVVVEGPPGFFRRGNAHNH
ncbi:MAG TPA: DNA-processing protein DprA [Polyangiaceae bacterium]|jgi:DNA processing protein|nr:DNA-processing protein DprA [Polyangiaceae bacterium]